MARLKTKTWLLFVVMFFLHPELNAAELTLAEQIALAEEMKSTDFARFTDLIKNLASNTEQLSRDQLDELNYLEGYYLVYSGRQKDALIKLNELTEKTSSNRIKFKSYGVMLNALVVSRNYGEVFKYFETFNDLLNEVSDNSTRSYGLVIISLVFNQINQFDLGLYYAQQLIDTTTVDRYRCIGMQFKLESLHRLKKFDDFNGIYQPAVDSCIAVKQPVYVGIIHSYKIEQLIDDAPGQALEVLKSNFSDVKNTSYKPIITLYKALYSAAYLRNGQIDLASEVAVEALQELQPDDINYAVLLLYSTLHEISKTKGNHKQALKYYETFVAKQKAFDDEKAAGLLAYNLAKAGIEVKNQRIELLNKDNELLYLQQDIYAQEVKRNRLIMLVLIVVLGIATVLAYKGITGRRRFKQMAEFDQLTGISNRYHFNNQSAVALDYCEKNAQPAAVILFDLDHFKSINDRFGHAVGDWALLAVVKTCRNFMRNNDIFGRIGGEEFAVVLPGCQTDKAVLLAEICRDAIANIDTELSGHNFVLTASFGVSGSDTSGYVLKQLLADADKAMYEAKDAGRDQVAAFAS